MPEANETVVPIPMRLPCPACSTLHEDVGDFATKPHHTHACQYCGNVWRPALVPTVGVVFLPDFRNEVAPSLPVARARMDVQHTAGGILIIDGRRYVPEVRVVGQFEFREDGITAQRRLPR